MRLLTAIFAAALAASAATATSVIAEEPSGFATDSPTTPPDSGAVAPRGGSTPIPTASNAPPVIAAAYAPYLRHGTSSVTGKISVRFSSGESLPPEGYPVYLIPATPYTEWYVGLHVLELKNPAPRTPTTPIRGFFNNATRQIYAKAGYAGTPDFTKPVPFTRMAGVAFHAVRTTRAGAAGRFAFGAVPAGSYLVLSHWPLKMTSTSYNTVGSTGYFGGYSGTTTENRSAAYVLMYFAVTSPFAVSAGGTARVAPNNSNASIGGSNCGQYGCARLAIDQWLTLDERNE